MFRTSMLESCPGAVSGAMVASLQVPQTTFQRMIHIFKTISWLTYPNHANQKEKNTLWDHGYFRDDEQFEHKWSSWTCSKLDLQAEHRTSVQKKRIHCNLAKINIKPHLLQAHSPRCPAGFGPLPESVVLSTGWFRCGSTAAQVFRPLTQSVTWQRSCVSCKLQLPGHREITRNPKVQMVP